MYNPFAEFILILFFHIEKVTWFCLRYHFPTSEFVIDKGDEIGDTQLRIIVNPNDMEGIIEFLAHKKDRKGLKFIEANDNANTKIITEYNKSYKYIMENNLPKEHFTSLYKDWKRYMEFAKVK